MTTSTTPLPPAEQDDAIIGKAFRISLAVIAGLVVVGLLIWYVATREEEVPEATDTEVEAPRSVEQVVEAPATPFLDVTAEAGIVFDRINGAVGDKFLPETMGGGGAFLDYDGDGDADLLLLNGAAWDGSSTATQALYANDGSGSFEDVTAAAGLDLVMQAMGVAVGDIDADGDPDLYLSGVADERLLRNDGGRFVDITEAAGIQRDAERWATSAAFFDADRDGDLDLFVCSYVRWSPEIDRDVDYRLTGIGRAYGPPTNYPGDHCRLLRNESGGGVCRFEDVSAAAGIQVANPATGVAVGKALALTIVDLDSDGWLDIAVANDTVANFLFHNQQDGTFKEVGFDSGFAFDRNGMATGAMGIDAADYRENGRIGLAIGNFANEMSSLYVARSGRLLFTDESIVDGIGAPSRKYLSFGLFFFDVDLDGRQDLLQVNGHLEDEISTVQPSQSFEQPAQLFWNAGPDGRSAFVEVAVERAGDLLARPIVGRGSAYADIDADGDLDVVLLRNRGTPILLRNDQELGNHWLGVRLKGSRSNREGIGALVVLKAGGQTRSRLVMPSRSYLSQVQPQAWFGLGASTVVDELKVIWPDGGEQEVNVEAIDQVIQVDESSSG